MLSATNALVQALFGSIFVAWLNCEAIQYLMSFAIIAIVIEILITFLKP